MRVAVMELGGGEGKRVGVEQHHVVLDGVERTAMVLEEL